MENWVQKLISVEQANDQITLACGEGNKGNLNEIRGFWSHHRLTCFREFSIRFCGLVPLRIQSFLAESTIQSSISFIQISSQIYGDMMQKETSLQSITSSNSISFTSLSPWSSSSARLFAHFVYFELSRVCSKNKNYPAPGRHRFTCASASVCVRSRLRRPPPQSTGRLFCKNVLGEIPKKRERRRWDLGETKYESSSTSGKNCIQLPTASTKHSNHTPFRNLTSQSPEARRRVFIGIKLIYEIVSWLPQT